MREIAISEFKAKCLALLETVHQTQVPLRVTRHGRPIADVIPPVQDQKDRKWLGSLAGVIKITGDIVAPVIELKDLPDSEN